jgi:hypothetical protein
MAHVIRARYGEDEVWLLQWSSGRQEDPDVQVRGERECIAVQLLKAIDELGRAHNVTYAAGVVNQVDEETIIDCTACGLQAAMVRGRGSRWEQQEAAAEGAKRVHHLQSRCCKEWARSAFIRLARHSKVATTICTAASADFKRKDRLILLSQNKTTNQYKSRKITNTQTDA